MLAFHPQTLASVSPTISTDQAVHWLIGVSPTATDVNIYAKDPETLAGIKIVAPPQALFDRLLAARHALIDGLRAAELHGYLWHPQRDVCLEVPRLYWMHKGHLDFDAPFKGAADIRGGSEDLDGMPPILSRREFELWVGAGKARLDCIAPPLPIAANRTRAQTARQKGVRDFLRYYEGLENPTVEPVGKSFHLLYKSWCIKNLRPSVERSAFYEELGRVRGSSGLTSATDGPIGA